LGSQQIVVRAGGILKGCGGEEDFHEEKVDALLEARDYLAINLFIVDRIKRESLPEFSADGNSIYG
jgi:hypothetical protein